MLSIFRSDASLVGQILSGKPHLFDELVRRHFSMVYGIALSYTHRHADAEDLSQETFLKAYQSLDTLQEPAKFGHWISQITRNKSRNWYTRIQREAAVLQDAASEASRSTTAASSAYDDLPEILGEQIEALDPIPREVLLLHYFSQKSTAEIAKAMDVSQAAVLKRLQRAREALGTRLIHELKIMPAAPTATAQHRKIIMSAVAASGLTWTLNQGTLGSILASTLLSTKGIVTTFVVASGIAATIILLPVYFESSQRTRATDLADFPSAESATKEDSQIDAGIELSDAQIEEPEPPTTVEVEVEEAAAAAELTQAVATDDEDVSPIEGEWNTFVSEVGMPEPAFTGVSIFKLEGVVLTATIQGLGELSSRPIEGEVHGYSVHLEAEPDDSFVWSPYRSPPPYGSFSGTFTPEYDELTVSGTLTFPGGDTGRYHGGADSGGDLERQLTIRFEKVSEHEKQGALALEKATERLQALREAVLEFISNSGDAPGQLASLYALLDEPEFIQDDPFESIEYFKPSRALVQKHISDESEDSGPVYSTKSKNWQVFLDTQDPGYLLAWEDELKPLWGDSFRSGSALLRLKNTRYNFTVSIGSEGGVRVKRPRTLRIPKLKCLST